MWSCNLHQSIQCSGTLLTYTLCNQPANIRPAACATIRCSVACPAPPGCSTPARWCLGLLQLHTAAQPKLHRATRGRTAATSAVSVVAAAPAAARTSTIPPAAAAITIGATIAVENACPRVCWCCVAWNVQLSHQRLVDDYCSQVRAGLVAAGAAAAAADKHTRCVTYMCMQACARAAAARGRRTQGCSLGVVNRGCCAPQDFITTTQTDTTLSTTHPQGCRVPAGSAA